VFSSAHEKRPVIYYLASTFKRPSNKMIITNYYDTTLYATIWTPDPSKYKFDDLLSK
jgi:hypothetical protein